jgi:hypothetical protein
MTYYSSMILQLSPVVSDTKERLNSNDVTGTGDINITGSITASANLAGTLTTATQTNITSVGTATASLGDLFTFRYNGAKWLEVGRNLALTLS